MRPERGAVTLEFTLVGIPLIFALISTVEISRGMWMYHTQAAAVNVAARYIVVHGAGCTTSGNSCTVTVGSIASVLSNSAVGMLPGDWNVTLYSASSANNQACNPLSTCIGNSTVWPPSPDNGEGKGIAISASYPFKSAIAMFYPGSKPNEFGTYNLPAYAQHLIQF